MKKALVVLNGLFFLLLWTGAVNADLIKIGTASYDSDNSGTIDDDEHYNLIYHADAPFGPIVWLDYPSFGKNWDKQNAWAAGLNLTYNLDGYSVAWDSSWRLPSTVDGEYVWGYNGTTTGGYNITSSEMGHLFYTELGNRGYYATDGTYPQPGWGLTNTGDFKNLFMAWYWSGTEYEKDLDNAWYFHTHAGNQDTYYKSYGDWGLAVRSGQVTIIPEPTTMLLFGVGLLGIAGISRKRTNSAPYIA